MIDLSHLALDGPWVTSQAAGNMASGNEQAQTAPGSVPVDPMPDRDHQGDPVVGTSGRRPVGTPPGRTGGVFIPPPIIWKAMGNG